MKQSPNKQASANQGHVENELLPENMSSNGLEKSEAPSMSSSTNAAERRKHRWERLPESYRGREVVQVAEWIRSGVSGCVVGLSESGRSNLLTFLSHRSDVLEGHLPPASESGMRVVIIPVDIYNLPANDLSSLYRTILHAFYWARDRIDPELHRYATELYLENRKIQDPFPPQMALYDLLRAFEDADFRVVLILNRFDRFCASATPQMLNTLRGLRDTFRGTLSYIVGMLQEAIYLSDGVSLGDLHDILDRHVCWVGSMTADDGRSMLFRDVLPPEETLSNDVIAAMLRLSGLFPGLLKTVGIWWTKQAQPESEFNLEHCQTALMGQSSMRSRLERIWNCLTQEEQLALSELQKLEKDLPKKYDPLAKIVAELSANADGTVVHYPPSNANGKGTNLSKTLQRQLEALSAKHELTLAQLATKGLCEQNGPTWWIKSSLLAAFIETQEGRARGRVWLDEGTKQLHQGQQIIQDLSGLQHEILAFLIRNPRIRHTNDDIISNAWPDEEQREGISDNALQVHIRSIRKRVEPNPAKPNYLVTWRGNPGGYIFYPEGRPD